MQNWNDIQYFLAVYRNRSYLKASQSLSVNASTVARRIEQLEEKLQTALFEKSKKGIIPTSMGRRLLDYASSMEKTAQSMEALLQEEDPFLIAQLSLNIPDELGAVWLMKKLGSFYKSYPEIDLTLHMKRESGDLEEEEADISLQLHEPQNPQRTCKKVGVLRFHVFAAPSYIDSMGSPENWAGLKAHKMIEYKGYEKNRALKLWQETLRNHDRVILRTDSHHAYIHALQNGLGLGLLPKFYHHAVHDLVALDLNTDVFDMPLYLVSLPHSEQSKALDAVRTFLTRLFEKDRKSWFS